MENLIDPIIILDEGEIIFQQFINDITRKLAVQIQQDEPDPAASLYSEKILGGYAVISEQHEGREESKIDLELLFNAVIENRDKINALFSQEVVHER
jgi:ABC-2 type transport system ATP-binding protein